MKKLLLISSISFGAVAFAQEAKTEAPASDTIKAWSIQGQNTLMLNQGCLFKLGRRWS